MLSCSTLNLLIFEINWEGFNCRLAGSLVIHAVSHCVHDEFSLDSLELSAMAAAADMIDKLTSQITHIFALNMYLWLLPISQFEKQEVNFRLANCEQFLFCYIISLATYLLTFNFWNCCSTWSASVINFKLFSTAAECVCECERREMVTKIAIINLRFIYAFKMIWYDHKYLRPSSSTNV